MQSTNTATTTATSQALYRLQQFEFVKFGVEQQGLFALALILQCESHEAVWGGVSESQTTSSDTESVH